MESSHRYGKEWVLSAEALDRLLANLDPDRERAAEKYESIRRRLITFFESRGCRFPEDLTDTTINRVARRILEGVEIYTNDPASFFFGVAKNVLYEYWQETARGPLALEDMPPEGWQARLTSRPEKEDERLADERETACLDLCLGEIPEDHREFIIQYYQGETGSKIRNRKRLAEQAGVPINVLRTRALRIRQRLETCLDDCMQRSA